MKKAFFGEEHIKLAGIYDTFATIEDYKENYKKAAESK